jgi:hypothetical protein
MGAINEGIQPAAICTVKKFPQTVSARGDIGHDQPGLWSIGFTRLNFKTGAGKRLLIGTF